MREAEDVHVFTVEMRRRTHHLKFVFEGSLVGVQWPLTPMHAGLWLEGNSNGCVAENAGQLVIAVNAMPVLGVSLFH